MAGGGLVGGACVCHILQKLASSHTPKQPQHAVPATLLPPALSLAVEKGFLRMGEAAPSADMDHFDKAG
jgi:hypothetical protein